MCKKTKILLIDNDIDFIEATKTVLEKNNYNVVTANNAQEGMNKVRFEQPDLIVLELLLEKHDSGFTFTKTIKADPLYKNIPILMLTAVEEKTGYSFSQELDGYWMKTNDYASKPVAPDKLLKRIENLLNTRKLAE